MTIPNEIPIFFRHHRGLEPMSGGDQLQDEVWRVGVRGLRGWWDGWGEHEGNMRELGFLELW